MDVHTIVVSPLIRKWLEIKEKHPDCLILFRCGDFYESFNEDAVKLSEITGVTLTKKKMPTEDIPLAGFPFYKLEDYLKKLVIAGNKVAIAEQLK